jgi:hypothetical protein
MTFSRYSAGVNYFDLHCFSTGGPKMAYIAFDTRLVHNTAKTRRVPAGLYYLLGGAMTALMVCGWGFWMINDVVPGAIQGMVLILGSA